MKDLNIRTARRLRRFGRKDFEEPGSPVGGRDGVELPQSAPPSPLSRSILVGGNANRVGRVLPDEKDDDPTLK